MSEYSDCRGVGSPAVDETTPNAGTRRRRRNVSYAGFLDHDEFLKMLAMADDHMAARAEPKGLFARAFGRKAEAA